MGYKFVCLLAIIATTCGLPRINDGQEQPWSGKETENVAFKTLKTKFSTRENLVFAPFGYASILAMLGEGARGETEQEIRKFLGLSKDSDRLRDIFHPLMARYGGGDEPSMVPQFKTWLYVYRNNSVNEDYVKTLREDYLVEVKTIERNFYDLEVHPASEPDTVRDDVPAGAQPFSGQVKESEIKINPLTTAEVNDAENTFDAVDFDGTNGKNLPEAEIDAIIKQKECSRFDEEVNDQQYVEAHELRDEKVESAAAAQAANQPEDNETVQPIEKLLDEKKIVKIDENAETLKHLDEGEEAGVLQEVKKHPVTKKFQAATARALEEINDVSSALSGNSLTGPRTAESQEQQSKMLLFNGFYFRGKWKTPFQRLRVEAEPGTVFYLQDEEEPIEVAMMRSRGEFKTGFSETYKAQMIELPYENERYAMLVVMPVERNNGLRNLVDRLDYATIKQLSSDLKLRTVDLSLPKFNVETTSTVHKEFAELGLTTLFSDAADLSGITGEQRLRVDELVQHVTVRVDEGASTENSISASDIIPRTATKAMEGEQRQEKQQKDEEDMFIVDRPFLFFVRDTIDDVTLVAGLINRPRGPQLFADIVTQDRATAAKKAGTEAAARSEGENSSSSGTPEAVVTP